jgi:hypothetical protein
MCGHSERHSRAISSSAAFTKGSTSWTRFVTVVNTFVAVAVIRDMAVG